MARKVSSASAKRRWSSGFSASKRSLVMKAASPPTNIETKQHPFLVGQVSNQSAQRVRKFFHQSRNCNNLLVASERRTLIDVDDLKLVTALQMFLANCPDRLKRLSG